MPSVKCEIYRFDPKTDKKPRFDTYHVPFEKGMRVLDALLYVQEHFAGDLALRWNCGEGICGSCAMEVNNRAVLACKEEIKEGTDLLRITPMKVFPTIKDLVPDISSAHAAIAPFKPWFVGQQKNKGEFYTIYDEEIREVSGLRKCIDCFICTDTCHVLRNHQQHAFIGPAGVVRLMAFDKHPKSTLERAPLLEKAGIQACNVTRCCQAVCPQDIRITENAIIPAKERIADDKRPFVKLLKIFTGKKNEKQN